jgi:hypothetical protein
MTGTTTFRRTLMGTIFVTVLVSMFVFAGRLVTTTAAADLVLHSVRVPVTNAVNRLFAVLLFRLLVYGRKEIIDNLKSFTPILELNRLII